MDLQIGLGGRAFGSTMARISIGETHVITGFSEAGPRRLSTKISDIIVRNRGNQCKTRIRKWTSGNLKEKRK